MREGGEGFVVLEDEKRGGEVYVLFEVNMVWVKMRIF